MIWLARLKKSAIAPENDPEKPTKPGFGGFGGTPAGLSQKSGGHATAANDPIQAQDFDREAFEERAAIMEFDAGLSRIEADKLALSNAGGSLSKFHISPVDLDRQCWPHTTAMNSAEIDSLTARFHLLTWRGLAETETERLADALVIRDRDGDDRRLCLECRHLRGVGPSRCGNARAADVHADLARDLVLTLQRCRGYLDARLPIEKMADAGHQHE